MDEFYNFEDHPCCLLCINPNISTRCVVENLSKADRIVCMRSIPVRFGNWDSSMGDLGTHFLVGAEIAQKMDMCLCLEKKNLRRNDGAIC
jgi:hypothetical protein